MPPSPSTSSDIASKVRETVHRTITEADLIATGESVLVAVSGGADSVALLHLLHELLAHRGTPLAVAHLDHGLRPEAGPEEAAFVLDLARRLDLPFHIRRADVAAEAREKGLSIEEAGRQSRYRFFGDLRRVAGYHRVAVGHHGDDNAELVLLNLLRGSGPAGLAGIPARRAGGIVRPLIRLRRSDLAAYLQARGHSHRIDPSNHDVDHLRNRIRHQLIPHLTEAYNPQVVPALNRLAEILREEEKWLDDLVEERLAGCIRRRERRALTLDVTRLEQHPPAARRRMIRTALAQVKGDLRRVSHVHVLAIMALGRPEAADGRRLDLPGRIRVFRRANALTLERMTGPLREAPGDHFPDPGPRVFDCPIPPPPAPGGPPARVVLPEDGRQMMFSILPADPKPEFHKAGQAIAFFDMEKLSFPLRVRNWRPGDRFTPLGMNDRLRVGRFLDKQNVSKPERNRVPVLESAGNVIWVVGHRIDEAVKIRPSTRRVLKAEIRLA